MKLLFKSYINMGGILKTWEYSRIWKNLEKSQGEIMGKSHRFTPRKRAQVTFKWARIGATRRAEKNSPSPPRRTPKNAPTQRIYFEQGTETHKHTHTCPKGTKTRPPQRATTPSPKKLLRRILTNAPEEHQKNTPQGIENQSDNEFKQTWRRTRRRAFR